jgi:hypothetical protein
MLVCSTLLNTTTKKQIILFKNFTPSCFSSLFCKRIYYLTNSKFYPSQKSKIKASLNTSYCQAMTTDSQEKEKPKKISKFKMFYQQYGPSFVIIHLTTVVAWIYLFYIISKQ